MEEKSLAMHKNFISSVATYNRMILPINSSDVPFNIQTQNYFINNNFVKLLQMK